MLSAVSPFLRLIEYVWNGRLLVALTVLTVASSNTRSFRVLPINHANFLQGVINCRIHASSMGITNGCIHNCRSRMYYRRSPEYGWHPRHHWVTVPAMFEVFTWQELYIHHPHLSLELSVSESDPECREPSPKYLCSCLFVHEPLT